MATTRIKVIIDGALLDGSCGKAAYGEIRKTITGLAELGAGYARFLSPVDTGTFRDSIMADVGTGLVVVYGHSDERIVEHRFLTWLERGERGGPREATRKGNRMFAKSASMLRQQLPSEMDGLGTRIVRALERDGLTGAMRTNALQAGLK